MSALYDRYRPTSIADICGFDGIKTQLNTVRQTVGMIGQSFYITGQSGTGKTTLARIIATEIADACCITEIDSQDVGVDTVRDWESECSRRPLFGEGFVYIVNEAHTLSGRIVSRLTTTLESPHIQKNATFIFTTTSDGSKLLFDTKFDALPFMSRCIHLNLTLDVQTIHAMADRLMSICDAEDLPSGDQSEFVDLLRTNKFNMRMSIQSLLTRAA